MTLIDEIREQPEALGRAITLNRDVAAKTARMASNCSHVVIAARGTSDNAARYAQYVWGIRNGLSVGLATPSMFSLYESPPGLDDTLVVGISQSGQSPDIVSVLEEARSQHRPTIAITNEPTSPLARTADVVIPLHAGEETAVAATKTYTSQLAVIALLSEAMLGLTGTLDALPTLVAAALERETDAREAAKSMSHIEHAAVLGRGYNLATAFEWALKMQELSYVVAQPFSTADFLHGPIAVVEGGFPVMALAFGGPTLSDVLSAVERTTDRGAPTLLITDTEEAADTATRALRIDMGNAGEWLTPIPAMAVAQLFTYWLTIEQGLDPDSPRGLKKVTRTT